MAGEPTFEPVVNPSFSIDDTRQPKLRMPEFGDGYSQTARDGMNHDPMQITLEWGNLSVEEHEDIWGFLSDRGGDEAFFYEMPFIGLAKWTAPQYQRSFKEPDTVSIRALFKQSFIP